MPSNTLVLQDPPCDWVKAQIILDDKPVVLALIHPDLLKLAAPVSFIGLDGASLIK